MASSRTPFTCANCARSIRTASTKRSAVRPFSVCAASSAPESTPSTSNDQLPRWRQTPRAMTMPFRLRPQPKQPVWRVNTEQEPLDAMYDSFVGRASDVSKADAGRGREMLTEEVKWLAITHKSFDHGRQGFNDRLAFLGKRIVDLQTSLALIRAPTPPHLETSSNNQVFRHPALEGLENVTAFTKAQVLSVERLAKIARTYGVDKVVRWKPRKSDNLQSSGIETVLAHTMYAIIGALSLQRGGEVAASVTRERILRPLGLK
ncbi:Hypothetical protein R9X50_00675100 [Acrodontium crateriforme]|uniref:RNase III domain-containing protein n=1 Tax=Acrodontium crateriforme TaxID=150365 RepID=A0AAQ3RDS0_9PEZI|nr:Hypothetical protein R9X50_00675100 [Acrodontium crateriforme]